MLRLRPYQVEIGRAILDSVLHRRGLTFSVEIARQGGKNELSAQVEVLLLTLFLSKGGSAVKASPTFKPQTVNSMLRLKERLDDAGFAGIWRSEMGYMVTLGRARQFFFSADKSAGVVGATANILLEIDESQDVGKEKYNKEFKPMGAATNVTTVHYGTTWDETTLLEEIKQTNLEMEKRDGIRRHFRFDWRAVGEHNPAYLGYVEGEKQRLGENHPLFITQYALLPLRGGGGFLSPRQKALLQGGHQRMTRPANRGIFVAGIDVGGAVLDAGKEKWDVENGRQDARGERHDATVVTIAEVDYSAMDTLDRRPRLLVQGHWHARNESPTDLFRQLHDLLHNVWSCKRIVIDATGIGLGLSNLLRSALGGRVVPFVFSEKSKSNLGFELLASINSGKLKMYAPDGAAEFSQFWTELDRAECSFRPNRTMAFGVPESKGHDDFLMSLALVVEAAARYQPRRAIGT